MANSNAMARADADKSHIGASLLVLDNNGDVGKVALRGKVMAWALINASSGTPVAAASANVSSITDIGTGRIGINLTTALPDTNFALLAGAPYADADPKCFADIRASETTVSYISINITTVSTTYVDVDRISIAVVR